LDGAAVIAETHLPLDAHGRLLVAACRPLIELVRLVGAADLAQPLKKTPQAT
jgi:hypothetical protein